MYNCITQNRPISANNLLIETINYFKLFLQLVLNYETVNSQNNSKAILKI